jgi:1,4-dihydroxy-2-naphthoate octaprenyltransferase
MAGLLTFAVMKSVLLSSLKFLAYTNLIVASTAAALCEVTFLIIGKSDHYLSAFVFFSTLLMYAYAQWFEAPARQEKNYSALSRWQQKHRVVYYICAVFGFAGMVVFFLSLSSAVFIWLGVCVLLAAIYPIQFMRQPSPLRNIPGLKLFIIAVVWSVVTVVLPAVQVGEQPGLLLGMLFIQRFFYITALAVAFDIRDLRIDSPDINTLPYAIGLKNARLAALACVFAAELASVHFFFIDLFTISFLAAHLIAFEAASFMLWRSSPRRKDLFFSAGIDSLPLLLLFLLLVFQYFWP